MAEFGSSEAGKKGGKARAERLTAEERSKIAKIAAEARWAGDIPKATHNGELKIGDTVIPCAVLEDGTRILTQQGFLIAIGRSGKPARGRGSQVEEVAPFLALNNLKPFVDKELEDSTKPIVFKVPSGGRAYGYKAELLPQVCEVYLKARDEESLLKSQEGMAKACEILMRALAHVGIVALVDEATGYQRDRDRDELAKILEAFVAKEIQKWLQTFDLEFYELICELRQEPLARAKKRPAYFGKLTNNLVYQRLAPGVLQKLQELNPVIGNGKRKRKHFQHLTTEMGHPKLKEHLAGVTTAMKMAKYQDLSWAEFLRLLDKTHPKYKPMPLFDGTTALD